MRKKFFSLLIVPHDNKKVRSLKVPSWITCLMVCVVTIIVFGTWIFVMDYQELKDENLELQAWRDAYSEQVERILSHAREVEYLKREVCGIKRLENRVKKLSIELKKSKLPSVSPPYASVRLLRKLGRGGPDLGMDASQPNLSEKIEKGMADLGKDISIGKQVLSELKKFLEKQLSIVRVTPNRWPLRGWITSRFGWRIFNGRRQFHTGIDIATYEGAPIKAAADGKVIFSGWKGTQKKGYGKLVIIDHGRRVHSYYGHNCSNLVRVGELVKKGQVIASVGSTGHATGPHLHYEIRIRGKSVNPFKYLR